MSEIEITANGASRRVPAGTTLADLVEVLELPEGRLAVERNGAVVPRERLASVEIAAGDRIEIVTLVGGG